MAPTDKYFQVLAATENYIAVNKSAGVLSIPGRGDELPDVLSMLRTTHQHVMPVHRIDKDTTGVLLFALNKEMHAHLSTQFTRRTIRKSYLALTTGGPPQDQGIIEFKLDISGQGKARVSHSGKPSKTSYAVKERFRGFCLLELQPLTGRLHQIRVHLSESGFPLVIDPLYGSAEPLSIADIKKVPRQDSSGEPPHPLLRRMPLHASEIWFRSLDGEEKHIVAPLPKDMRATLNQLRKWRPVM